MEQLIYKVLGKRGRITIPWELRQTLGFSANDIVSFAVNGNTVLIKKEKICTGCTPSLPETGKNIDALTDLLDSLPLNQLRTVLVHLSVRWAELQAGGIDDV